MIHAVQSICACTNPGFRVVILVVVNEPEDVDPTITEINHNSAV